MFKLKWNLFRNNLQIFSFDCTFLFVTIEKFSFSFNFISSWNSLKSFFFFLLFHVNTDLGWNKVSPTHHHILLEKKLFSSSFVQNYSFVRCWDLQKKKIEAKLLSFVSDKTCCRKNFKIFCKKKEKRVALTNWHLLQFSVEKS